MHPLQPTKIVWVTKLFESYLYAPVQPRYKRRAIFFRRKSCIISINSLKIIKHCFKCWSIGYGKIWQALFCQDWSEFAWKYFRRFWQLLNWQVNFNMTQINQVQLWEIIKSVFTSDIEEDTPIWFELRSRMKFHPLCVPVFICLHCVSHKCVTYRCKMKHVLNSKMDSFFR